MAPYAQGGARERDTSSGPVGLAERTRHRFPILSLTGSQAPLAKGLALLGLLFAFPRCAASSKRRIIRKGRLLKRGGKPMLRFIINENLKNFHELLQRSTDPNERER